MHLVIGTEQIISPSKERIEEAINDMGEVSKRWVALSPSGDEISPRIIATGGDNAQVMVSFYGLDDDIPSICVNHDSRIGNVQVWDGSSYNSYPSRYVISKGMAIRAFKYFFDFQDKEPNLIWEER